jgi:predicted ferric reductase
MQYIYRISTGSQTVTAKIWRGFLDYTCGLDYALEFHMLCGITGYFCAIMHTFAHVMNFATRAEEVWSKFGWWIWFTGIGLLTCLTILVSAAHRNVRRNHFYIFYYTHMLYWPITFFNFFHGAGYFGPNFWKFAIVPIGIFVLDRIHRKYKERIPVSLIDFTNMGVVTTISLGKESMPEYSEGHYAFVNCPHVSEYEWHPFTISSAPQEPFVTFHMRIQGEGSWTRRVKDYLTLLAPPNKPGAELWHQDSNEGKRVKGKSTGPDGLPYFHIYGPCSAPTQHLSEYDEVMICASGIGVTPLSSAMKSIVFHKWKKFIGRCFPDRAHFFWCCSHRDIKSFRWFVRTIKEAEDAVVDLTQKNNDSIGAKMFHVHIFVTSYKESNVDMTGPKSDSYDDDVAFWGRKRAIDQQADLQSNRQVVHYGASFTEWDLYSAIMQPSEGTVSMGHVHIHKGRPAWDEFFQIIMEKSTAKDIGVTFCGNPMIGSQLSKCSAKYTALSGGTKQFHLHQEVF